MIALTSILAVLLTILFKTTTPESPMFYQLLSLQIQCLLSMEFIVFALLWDALTVITESREKGVYISGMKYWLNVLCLIFALSISNANLPEAFHVNESLSIKIPHIAEKTTSIFSDSLKNFIIR